MIFQEGVLIAIGSPQLVGITTRHYMSVTTNGTAHPERGSQRSPQ